MIQRDILLSKSTIDNGRIYFPSTDIRFFPADSFGDRAIRGHVGTPVVFRAGDKEYKTDVRISSGQRVSPRSSFGSFLKEVGATGGSVLRVSRISDREYVVELLP